MSEEQTHCGQCQGKLDPEVGCCTPGCPCNWWERYCATCSQEAEELRVVGPDHRNTADYASGTPHCPQCDAAWPPPVQA